MNPTATNPNFNQGISANVNPSDITNAIANQSTTPIQTPTVPTSLNGQNTAPSTPITLPQASNNTPSSIGANATIPTPQSIIAQETTQTPAEQQTQLLMQRIADLTGTNQTQNQLTTTSENNAGIPGLTKTYNDLGNQLQTLNDQSTKLSNDANYTIPNQEQNSVIGQGVTTGGLAPIQTAALRNNQIQQGAIATQALTVKSALYYAQGNLAQAKASADAAATATFEGQQQQLAALNAQIDAIKPQLTKEESAQADLVKTQLADRQNQITQQKTDYTAGLGLINEAMKTNGQNPQAQLAIQAAQKVDPTDPQYLQKVGTLLTQYQTDPVATQKALLDNQLLRAQISKAQYDAQISKNNANASSGNTIVQDSKGNNISVPVSVAPYVNTSNSGVSYADLSAIQGTAAEKKQIVDQAQASGLKVILNKNTSADLVNIGDANAKLDSISTIMAGIDQPDALSRDLYGLGLSKLAVMAQTDPQKAAAGSLQSVGLDILKAISGIQGFRGNSSVVQQVTEHLPSIYDTNAVAQQKITYIRALISDRENSILGTSGTNASSQGQTVKVNGQSYTVGQVYSDGTGNWTVDAQGKWTKQ